MPPVPANTAVLEATAKLGRSVVIWHDSATGHAWCSKTSQDLLAYPAGSMAAIWAGDLHYVAETERSAVVQARSGSGPDQLQFRMTRGDGSTALIDAVFTTAEDGERADSARIAVLRDVSGLVNPDRDQGIFDELSQEARFTNCRATNTVHFGTGLKRVYGIDLTGSHRVPTPFVERIHPDDRERAFEGYYTLIETTHGFGEIEYRLRRGDGTYAMVRERFHPERDAAGQVVAVHSTVTDITNWHEERKRRELLAGITGLVVVDFDPRCNRMLYSGATEKILGYALSEMPPTPEGYLDLVHPDDRPILQGAIESVRAGAVWLEPLEVSYRLRRADGSYAHLLDHSITVTDAEGKAEGVIVVLTDVSALLRDKEELRLSLERLKALAALSGQIVEEMDITTGKVSWSGAVREQLGFDPEELPTDPMELIEMIHPEDRPRNMALFQRLKDGEIWHTPVHLSFRTRHKDGRVIHIQKRAVCVLDDKGRVTRVLQVLNDVTDLLRKQDQLVTLADIASDASYEYYHREGRIIFNQGFKNNFGHDWAGEHGLHSPWEEYVHPDDLAPTLRGFLEFAESDLSRYTCEYRFRRADGSWAIVSEKVAALRDDDGHPTLIIGSLDDVTEQRQTSNRLREAVEALDSGFALYDSEQRLILHNARFAAMNSGVSDLIRPGIKRDDLVAAMVERHLLLVPEKAVMSETPDGFVPVNADVTQASGALYNVRVNPTSSGDWVSLITDVTKVAQDQQKLRAMFEVSADAMFELDVEHGTIEFDSGFRTQFGYDYNGKYAVPSPWEHTVHPDDYPRVKALRDEFLASRRARVDLEFRMQRGDGSWAYVAERAVALRDEKGKAILVLGAVADLTEQRLLEEKLYAAQKMESIGRIAGGIAHDFNNLLAVIMGNAELMTMTSDDPDLKECVDEIVGASKRGAELTRRLLSFARRSRLAPEKVDVNDMVAGMGQIFSRVLPKSISLQTSLQAGLWSTKVDPAFLESALLNLVINARDAMPDGGTLTIETANQRVTEDYGIERNETVKPGRYIMLAVTDTGHGIPRELIERVIEPFFTTKGPNLGSGLGLSMVDGFARQSGGLLRIYSEAGHGTTIKILLPAEVDDSTKGLASTSAQQMAVFADNLRVLLVEDEPKVREVIARTLQAAGLHVVEADSGDAAMEAYAQMPHRPHILLTDVVMPGSLPGPALAKKLKAIQPDLQILFMSGYANEAAINGNGLRPDDVFLMKPIQRHALLDALSKIARNLP